ncbi:MAG: hypothetical protein WC151_01245 [Bacteroidales bacterium]|nr:hypothetical protein [Bacteroidales bacterium]
MKKIVMISINAKPMKDILYRIAVLAFLLFPVGKAFSQELPPGLRNFLITFSESSSLGKYDPDLMVNRIDERVIDQFMESFVSPDAMVFNDVYHRPGRFEYVTVQAYCDIIAEQYPQGLRTFVYSPELLKVVHKNESILYEIEVEKFLDIDFGMDNPPRIYFDPFTRLKLSVLYNGDSYRILMIEESRSALAPGHWVNRMVPQSVALQGAIGSNTMKVTKSPESYGDFSSGVGTVKSTGLQLKWDVMGHHQWKAGILAGVEYQGQKSRLLLDSYFWKIQATDRDGYSYQRFINASNVQQDYAMNLISVPLGLHFNYAFGQKWKPLAKRVHEARKRYPVKRNFRLGFDVGVKLNYLTSSIVADNRGTYSYTGKYAFWNNAISDTSYLIVDDLPEYGFFQDTTFRAGDLPSEYNDFNLSAFTAINIYYPVTPSIELYLGPVLNFSLTAVNSPDDNLLLSSEVGQSMNFLTNNQVTHRSIGIQGGLVFNIKPPKNEYYPYPKLNKTELYKPTKSSVKYRGSKQKAAFTLATSSTFRQKLRVELTGEWMTRPEKIRITSGRSKRIKVKVPSDPTMRASGELSIRKPFGVEVQLVDCEKYNDVNNSRLLLPLDTILASSGCIVNRQLNLAVEKLPPFNFVYVTLKGRDDANARKDLVNELRKIYRKARFEDEEILIYISTEINRPVVFCNFDVPDSQHLQFKIFDATGFDEFVGEVTNKYNSAIEDYEEDIHNLQKVMGESFSIDQRLNAARRYVNFYFLPVDVTYYRIPGYIESSDNSIIQDLILSLTNTYCLDVPVANKQYNVFVHLRADQYKEISMGKGIPVNECNNQIVLY